MKNFALDIRFITPVEPKRSWLVDMFTAGRALRQPVYLSINIAEMFSEKINYILVKLPEDQARRFCSIAKVVSGHVLEKEAILSYDNYIEHWLPDFFRKQPNNGFCFWVDMLSSDRQALTRHFLSIADFLEDTSAGIQIGDIRGFRGFLKASNVITHNCHTWHSGAYPHGGVAVQMIQREFIYLFDTAKEEIIWTKDFTPERQKMMLDEYLSLQDVAKRAAAGEFRDPPAFEDPTITKESVNVFDPEVVQAIVEKAEQDNSFYDELWEKGELKTPMSEEEKALFEKLKREGYEYKVLGTTHYWYKNSIVNTENDTTDISGGSETAAESDEEKGHRE